MSLNFIDYFVFIEDILSAGKNVTEQQKRTVNLGGIRCVSGGVAANLCHRSSSIIRLLSLKLSSTLPIDWLKGKSSTSCRVTVSQWLDTRNWRNMNNQSPSLKVPDAAI